MLTVPTVLIYVEPPHVLRAVFSTFPKPTSLLLTLAENVVPLNVKPLPAEYVVFVSAVCAAHVKPPVFPDCAVNT